MFVIIASKSRAESVRCLAGMISDIADSAAQGVVSGMTPADWINALKKMIMHKSDEATC